MQFPSVKVFAYNYHVEQLASVAVARWPVDYLSVEYHYGTAAAVQIIRILQTHASAELLHLVKIHTYGVALL